MLNSELVAVYIQILTEHKYSGLPERRILEC